MAINKRLIKRLQEALAPKGLWIDDFSDVPLDRPIKIWRPDVNEGFLGEGDTIEEAFENAGLETPAQAGKGVNHDRIHPLRR